MFSKKKNVIMIMVDGARHDAIAKVPFYDKLKKEGTYFPYLISYAPYTIGSLHALFSGLSGNHNGVNGYYNSYNFDTKNCFTLAQYFSSNGYHTECDLIYESIVPNQGFLKVRAHDEFKDDLVERHTEILRRVRKKKPFFLFLDYSKLHTKLVTDVIKKYDDFDVEYFKNKDKNFSKYLSWVKTSGDYLEEIFSKIKEFGLFEDSYIFVFTDHGASVGDKKGERAYGVYLYEYSLRSFLYAIGPEFPKGVEVSNLIRSVDIVPTFLDLFNFSEKDGYKKLQGKSILPLLSKPDNRVAYSETGGLGGPTPSPEKHNVKCIRTNDWKLIYNETSKEKELYNLKEDPLEENNLVGKEVEKEKELWEKLKGLD